MTTNEIDSETPPPSFRQYCNAELNEDGTLTVSCAIRDKHTGEMFRFEETVDPQPIAQLIAHNLIAMSGETSVAGLGSFLSKAKNAAVKVASNNGIKAVWKKVSPVVKELAKEVPGGGVAIALAAKTADTVAAARKGDKKALETLKNAAAKAVNGNELAAEVMKTAKTLSTMMDIKEGKDGTDLAKRLALIERTLSPLIPAGNRPVPVSAFKVAGKMMPLHKAIAKKKAAMRSARAARNGTAIQANRPAPIQASRVPFARAPMRQSVPIPVAKQFPIIAPAPSPEAYADESYYGDESYDDYGYDEYGEEVAGLYHRPFRSPLAAAAQGSFGLSTTLRSLYSNGLETIAAMAK